MLPLQWPANEAVKHIKSVWEAKEKYEKEFIDEQLEIASKAWSVKRDSAATAGTDKHELLELYVKGRIDGQDVKTLRTPYANDNQMIGFFDWEDRNEVEWLFSELVTGSAIHKYGGKLDGLCMISGRLSLIDFKTSNTVFDMETGELYLGHSHQFGGYLNALYEMGCPKIQDRYILWLKNGTDIFEPCLMKTDTKKDIDAFLMRRNLYKLDLSYKGDYKHG